MILPWHGVIFDGHICAVSKCAFCKLGMLMFRLRQQQVYRPQTTPVRSGACSQSVTGWQKSVRGATAPPGKTQKTHLMGFRFSFYCYHKVGKKQCWHPLSIKTLVSNYLLSEWFFIESIAVRVFCITSARDPWKGFFKESNSALYTPHGVASALLVFLGRLCTCFCFSLHGGNVMTC